VDTPRRWQVASLATAVTSLGIGALIVSRPSVEPVAPIVLDVRASADGLDLDPIELDDADDAPSPEIVGADVVTPQTPASLASIASPDGPSSTTTGPAPSPTPTATSSPPAPTTRTAPAAEDSPASVDSPDSLDSDD
jgi:hypothetical protein